jgi:hypothetical protein
MREGQSRKKQVICNLVGHYKDFKLDERNESITE